MLNVANVTTTNHHTHCAITNTCWGVLRTKNLNIDEIANRESAIVTLFFKTHKITKQISATSAKNKEADMSANKKVFDPIKIAQEFVDIIKQEETINLYTTNQSFRLILIAEATNISDITFIGNNDTHRFLSTFIRELKAIECLYKVKQALERVRDSYEDV